MTSFSQWFAGARPKTLAAALAPVFAGTGAAALVGSAHPGKAGLAAAVALALQVGVNYANDYSDGVRGTDDVRVGPMRLVGSGAASPRAVRNAAFGALAVAALCGGALVAWTGMWWLLVLGVVCIVAAWFYTGGPKPYGYLGLGELMVFIFFGLVATCGTTLTQAGQVTAPSVCGAVMCGALSVALMMTNNLRDLPLDVQVGKKTLAVRLGDTKARYFLVAQFGLAAAAVVASAFMAKGFHPLIALLPLMRLVVDVRNILDGAEGEELIEVLEETGRASLFSGALLATGFGLMQ